MKAPLEDIEVAYTRFGDGDPVVLLHGLAEDRHSWAPVHDALADHQCFTLDMRGHGATTLGDGDGTLSQLRDDLARFVDSVTGPARCIGYSLGGTVVLALAAARPDLVRHAVVAATSTIVGRAAASFFDQRIGQLDSDRAAFASALRDDTAAQIVTCGVDIDAVAARRLAAIGDGGGYINAARAMQRMAHDPLTPQLANIECPVDVIGADRDQFCPRKAADIMMAALRGACYHEIADCGHLMTVDQPQAYGKILHEILTGTPAMTGSPIHQARREAVHEDGEKSDGS